MREVLKGIENRKGLLLGTTGAESASEHENQAVSLPHDNTSVGNQSLNPETGEGLLSFTATIVPQYCGSATGTVTLLNGATTLSATAVYGNSASYNGIHGSPIRRDSHGELPAVWRCDDPVLEELAQVPTGGNHSSLKFGPDPFGWHRKRRS